ncbi:hypothetical protein E5676_scaffold265G001240 [Cucumis melo var. makuwa]|uniref:Integrase catalytic domain-containing protein n=1 Tax=Cucumis melo var. makuwa TaxID=1194695 RepID=A0A5D3C9Z3_CUCMM|nr:hypothetical protein E5676_scaffold265G001240 [Cucumis melo var. makuwa]
MQLRLVKRMLPMGMIQQRKVMRKSPIGYNGTCDVKGTGSVQVATHDGMIRMLTNVRYVPELKRNLVSLGELDRSGYTIKSESGVMKVTKGSLVKLRGTLRNGLLAHVSERSLQLLSQQGLLGGVKDVELPFYEHCIMEKSTRVKFGRGKHTTKGILDYVHSNFWGPTKVTSTGGSRYFMFIIDDFSRKVWMYPLKQKDEVFEKFLEWKKQVENQTGRKVKYLRIDNGLEFVNNKFNNFYKSEGIMRHFTVTYTPQQNGEAAEIVCYLSNRSPSTTLSLKVTHEVWIEVKVDLEVRPSIGLDVSSDQSPLVSQIEPTQQSESDGIQSQQERTFIDEGASSEKSSSNNDLQNYKLTRDRAQRERHAPSRYGYADLVAYALTCGSKFSGNDVGIRRVWISFVIGC